MTYERMLFFTFSMRSRYGFFKGVFVSFSFISSSSESLKNYNCSINHLKIKKLTYLVLDSWLPGAGFIFYYIHQGNKSEK